MRALAAGLFAALCGCMSNDGYQPTVEGGDPKRGRVAVAELECGACHIIPGVPGAVGRVGPPLNEYARNVYIAGNYPNVPNILIQFVRDAPSFAPQTAMPAIEMSEAQSRDIAAFLYSLQ